jgi:hypothetical protein
VPAFARLPDFVRLGADFSCGVVLCMNVPLLARSAPAFDAVVRF